MAASIGSRHLQLKEQLWLAEKVFQNGSLHTEAVIKRTILLPPFSPLSSFRHLGGGSETDWTQIWQKASRSWVPWMQPWLWRGVECSPRKANQGNRARTVLAENWMKADFRDFLTFPKRPLRQFLHFHRNSPSFRIRVVTQKPEAQLNASSVSRNLCWC